MTDVLIVGAGSAGCVLAERLSADPSCRVTLLEAGGTGRPDPGWVLPIGVDSALARQHRTALTQDPVRPADLVRGRVLGGSGAINGGYFCWGSPSDFAGWALPGWGWSDVLPHFRAIETDHDFAGTRHGSAGPVPVRRTREFALSAQAFAAGASARYRWIDDLNS
ncbi:MAG: GMC family oxidoreductase N-terminal domain-containing protein, partial [Mycobacterium sp.]|nr:GMC family oxidoreductase N-terminal domain-containing protein [Mycobacterium sp.]